jgi:hypothetical protein
MAHHSDETKMRREKGLEASLLLPVFLVHDEAIS